ncbi:hypothetical protein PUN28_019065 [Cardiocondyla obscurior]|uniref:Ribosomal protein S11 n=1 Tax=Cardiocondyla obscurior TaxID=286306 RepID=A0AAW2EEM3_9HYME
MKRHYRSLSTLSRKPHKIVRLHVARANFHDNNAIFTVRGRRIGRAISVATRIIRFAAPIERKPHLIRGIPHDFSLDKKKR